MGIMVTLAELPGAEKSNQLAASSMCIIALG